MKIIQQLVILLICVLCSGAAWSGAAPAAAASSASGMELNFVFLHGFNGNSSAMQLLQDSIVDQLPAYITNYQSGHPEINFLTDNLIRSYPNDVDIETWANNIADSINRRFAGKKNLVLIGHSMGGKTALYAVSHNTGNIADKVAMVVTINSPIKSLANYYYVGGDTALDYWAAQMLLTNKGAVRSLVNYDSSEDGKWVAANKHWLAFISCESAPLSSQFNVRGVDPMPRDMDDTIVPISGQYADGADAVYYGEYGHSDFSVLPEVATNIASQTLRYIFGGNIECTVLTRAGSFEHKASLWPGTVYWQNSVGEVLASSGSLTHRNDSYIKWQSWEDTVGEIPGGTIRSTFQTTQNKTFPLFSGITQADWANSSDPKDGRLNLKTRAAPRSNVQLDWSIYQPGFLPSGTTRDHYEVEIETGTQLTAVTQVAWETNDPRDVRLTIASQTPGPFRWFRAQWRVYYKESRDRRIIDEIAVGAPQP